MLFGNLYGLPHSKSNWTAIRMLTFFKLILNTQSRRLINCISIKITLLKLSLVTTKSYPVILRFVIVEISAIGF